MVRHPAQAKRALALAGVLATALLAGCGGGGERSAKSPAAGGPRVVEQDLGADYRLANCVDWRRGTPQQRKGTIEEIRGFAGGPVGNDNGQGNVLSPQQAYRLFADWCARPYARHFKLYKLYVRAAAFTPPQG